MGTGTITLNFEGASLQETERFRLLITNLFEQGVFNIKNGNATLHFDNLGTLQAIDVNFRKWRREKK